jgi:hypothetical protein
MNGSNITPSPDDVPAVDRAESVTGHPHTLGVEFTDDEILVGEGPGSPDMAEFGEAPDVETHSVETHSVETSSDETAEPAAPASHGHDENVGAPSPDL